MNKYIYIWKCHINGISCFKFVAQPIATSSLPLQQT